LREDERWGPVGYLKMRTLDLFLNENHERGNGEADQGKERNQLHQQYPEYQEILSKEREEGRRSYER
jgi:hypothetical protein